MQNPSENQKIDQQPHLDHHHLPDHDQQPLAPVQQPPKPFTHHQPNGQPQPTQPVKEGGFKLHFAVNEEPNLGVRKEMEDCTISEPDLLGDGRFAFFCILDGHGGYTVSRFVRDNYAKLLKSKLEGFIDAKSVAEIINMTIDNTEKQLQMIGGRDCGSTFSGILFDLKVGRYYVINIGDSRSVRMKQVGPGQVDIKALSLEHKCSNEEEVKRVEKAGGSILNGRLAGNLIITRSLGDFDFKKYGLISTPDIFEHHMEPNEVFVIASDGIWDTVHKENLEKMAGDIFNGSLAGSATKLTELAVSQGSTDNISIILVKS